jgi:FKBP-type peptidyl-prolyl cis-trans isomerase FklB
MNKSLLAAPLFALSLIANQSVVAEESKNLSLKTEEEKVSYSFGVVFGKRMLNDLPELEMEKFVQGMNDSFNGKPQALSDDEVSSILTEYQRSLQQKQVEAVQKLGDENKKVGEAFLKANQSKEGVITLESGLQYKILSAGKGPQPGASDTVKVHYTGSLINGEVFDSSVDRGEPVSFPVNGVIAGWTEALQLMQTGAKWQLYIPADLAYGANGNRSIGPNETLLFDVELLEVAK